MDWTLLALLSDSDLDAAALTEMLYDLPPRRSGYLREIAHFEYGVTRSRYLGDDRLLVLIPAGTSPEERRDQLAAIADEERKNLGEIPTTLWVFEYRWHQQRASRLQVRLVQTLAGEELFTTDSGYTELTVDSLESLEGLLESIDDVTYARLGEGDRILVGGRRVLGSSYRGLGVEEVATLWQAEKKLQPALTELEAFQEKWAETRYTGEDEKLRLEVRRDLEWSVLQRRLAALQGSSHDGLVQGIGFSLDWSPKYPELLELFRENMAPRLGRAAKLRASSAARQSLDHESSFALDPGPIELTADVLQRIDTELSREEHETYLALAYHFTQEPRWQRTGLFMQQAFSQNQFQLARYDGDLQGTEVGMVLFYTDLLAKLYALDFACQTPRAEIPGFIPLTYVRQSPVFDEELRRHSSTRLWFGPLDEGFQPLEDNALAFGRRGTRVYAASSNNLRPGEESDPNARSAAFLGWWNDHYDEVARHEPEYQRLDQIMKWSTLLSWLRSREASGSLDFLARHPVQRDLWFPRWVQEQPELRFQQWQEIGFEERGYRGQRTEALPLLSSERFADCGDAKTGEPVTGEPVSVVTGGVSLAKARLFTTRRALRAADLEATPFLRGAIDLETLERTSDGLHLRTLAGAEHTFAKMTSTTGTVRSKPRAGARLRSEAGELAHGSFERRLQRGDGWLAVDVGAEGLPLGRFEAGRTANGFQVGWAARELDAGQSLARRLSRAEDLSRALRRDAAVDSAVELEKGGFAVRLKGTDGWLRLVPETTPSLDIASGFQARVAAPEGAQHTLQLASIERAQLPELLEQGELLRAGKALGPDGELLDTAPPRGPPTAVAELPQRDFSTTPQQLEGQLESIDRALAEGRSEHALEAIDRLLSVAGDRPSLRLRRGLALLDQHRLREAAESVSSRAWRHDPGVDSFFDEINRRIEDPQLSPRQRDSARRLAEYAHFNLRRALGTEVSEEAVLDAAGNTLRLRINIPRDLRAQKLDAAELQALAKDSSRQKPGLFYFQDSPYLQDSPGLANLDWASSPVRALHEISSGSALADVYRLPASDIGRYNPAEIYAPAVSPAPLRRVESDEPSDSLWSLDSQLRPPIPSSTPGECPDAAPGCEEKDAPAVYLVIPRPAA
ncbi:MAG: hypothetical protein SX243_01745 [Acidobacteriota bacterium]|nr:hypothetical protein [Acidobacteriota bacterium]